MISMPPCAFVALLRIELHFASSNSLKAKRKELKSLKERMRSRFGASVVEMAHHDLWQRSDLFVAIVGESAFAAERAADGLGRWLDANLTSYRVDRHLISLEDLR